MRPKECDVAVIGGGPAGSTAATLIAQKGYDVALFERDHFPRFHIGESLIPQTYEILQRMNLIGPMKSSRFVKKYSVQFITEHGKVSEPFYFINYKPHESSQTWQVRRSEFDKMLLDNARDHGVAATEGARVLEVTFDNGRATGLRVRSEDGTERAIAAKVVVDAGGQSSVILDRLKLRRWDPDLKKAAIWTYFRGARRESGIDEGATLVMQTRQKKGWFWYIPLHDDVVSVGVVADFDYLLKNRGDDLGRTFFEEVDRCPGVAPRIAGAERCDVFRAAKEYSYRATKAAGDGWVLVGDAFGFLDPLYSSGVLLALKSGQMAADAITDGLAVGDTSEARLRRWEPEYVRGMDRMRRLVREFYDGFNFGKFVKAYPHLKDRITDILIGDLFKDEVDQLWGPIDAMRSGSMAEAAA